ncbi:MAG: hypothetical protein ACOYK9_06555 [Chlamydiia bacterium]
MIFVGLLTAAAFVFRENLVDFRPSLIKLVPKALQTQDMANAATTQDPSLIQYVRGDLQTLEMAVVAIKYNLNLFQYVREDLRDEPIIQDTLRRRLE